LTGFEAQGAMRISSALRERRATKKPGKRGDALKGMAIFGQLLSLSSLTYFLQVRLTSSFVALGTKLAIQNEVYQIKEVLKE
jgi:hypothetical protein